MSNSRFNGKRTDAILASTSATAIKLLSGKTLNEVGFQNGLVDADLKIITSTTKEGDEIESLQVKLKGSNFIVPFSWKFPMEKVDDADFMLSCEFRLTHKTVRDENGNPTKDENGKIIYDETAPYLSFGKPGGFNITDERDLFAKTPESVEKKLEASTNA